MTGESIDCLLRAPDEKMLCIAACANGLKYAFDYVALQATEKRRYYPVKEKIERMNEYFAAQIDRCAQRGKALAEDGRADEADFEKIKANVYDIFRTVLAAAEKQGGGDAKTVEHFFAERTEKIPENWKISCAQAEAHGDTAKAHIEHLKLNTLAEIKAQFVAIWEGAR